MVRSFITMESSLELLNFVEFKQMMVGFALATLFTIDLRLVASLASTVAHSKFKVVKTIHRNSIEPYY